MNISRINGYARKGHEEDTENGPTGRDTWRLQAYLKIHLKTYLKIYIAITDFARQESLHFFMQAENAGLTELASVTSTILVFKNQETKIE
jgi:hypothetical protein